MMNMTSYYDFSGQKFGYPLSLSINSFDRHIFSRQNSLELSYVLQGEYQIVTEKFTSKLSKGELVMIAPGDIHLISHKKDGVILTIHIDFDRMTTAMSGNSNEAFSTMIVTIQRPTPAPVIRASKVCGQQIICAPCICVKSFSEVMMTQHSTKKPMCLKSLTQ